MTTEDIPLIGKMYYVAKILVLSQFHIHLHLLGDEKLSPMIPHKD